MVEPVTVETSLETRYTLREGVEIFISQREEQKEDKVVFLYLGTRRRLTIECDKELVDVLRFYSEADASFQELSKKFPSIETKILQNFFTFLHKESILIPQDFLSLFNFLGDFSDQLRRQLYFFLDTAKSTEDVVRIQRDISTMRLSIWGLGAVGSQIIRLLAMMGFRRFHLIDFDVVERSDISRSAYKVGDFQSQKKVEACKSLIEEFMPSAEVEISVLTLRSDTDLELLHRETDLIINAADEPYIGYTNLKLSRFCLEKNIPLAMAGGFDAHLASSGEFFIPFKTPCADCYANYFTEALSDWKPKEHPVSDRKRAFGGLASLSVFSASSLVLDILQFIIDPNFSGSKGRGELLFKDYSFVLQEIERDPNCFYCGDSHAVN